MKKQYLIGLLGLVAVSVPMGNSLLNVNSNPIPIEEPEKSTGLSVNSSSSVSFWDMNNDSEVNNGEWLQSINLTIDFNKNSWNNDYKPGDITINGLNFYSSIKGEDLLLKEYSYEQIKGISSTKTEEQIIITVNDEDNSQLALWGYKYIADETFKITADYVLDTEDPDGEDKETGPVYEDSIGEVDEIISNNFSGKKTIIKETKVAVNEEENTYNNATLNYTVEPGTNYNNEIVLEVEKVIWGYTVGEGEDSQDIVLASSIGIDNGEDENGDPLDDNPNTGVLTTNKLEANETYSTWLKVEMNDGIIYEELPTEINNLIFSANKSSDPTFSETKPTILVDINNDILEVKGQINTNGSQIKEIKITKEVEGNKIPIITNNGTKFIEQDSILYYDVLTPNYTENNIHGVRFYAIEVIYVGSFRTVNYQLDQPNINDNDIKEANLSPKIDNNDSTGMGGGAIILIIIAVLVAVGIIVWAGKKLYKKYNSNDGDNESNQEEKIEETKA